MQGEPRIEETGCSSTEPNCTQQVAPVTSPERVDQVMEGECKTKDESNQHSATHLNIAVSGNGQGFIPHNARTPTLSLSAPLIRNTEKTSGEFILTPQDDDVKPKRHVTVLEETSKTVMHNVPSVSSGVGEDNRAQSPGFFERRVRGRGLGFLKQLVTREDVNEHDDE